MNKRKYFHLFADGKTVKKISGDEWFQIILRRMNRLVATTYRNEISLTKGNDHIFLRKNQLDDIFKEESK